MSSEIIVSAEERITIVETIETQTDVVIESGPTTDIVLTETATTIVLSDLPGPKGDPGNDGSDGADGDDGLSAYQVAVNNGFAGTESEWLASLQGADGVDGTNGLDGADGDSAYQIAVSNGFVGTESEWLASLIGTNGENGESAYELAVANGFVGTESAWLASLVGAPGTPGTPGVSAPTDLGLIAYSDNRTGIGTTGPAGSDAAVLGCVIVIPPTDRDVWLEHCATIGIATAGQGYTQLTVWDITSGFATGSPGISFIRSYSNEIVTSVRGRIQGGHRVGPSTTLRTYMLTVKTVQEGSSLSGYTSNAVALGNTSYLKAVGQ